MRLASTQALGNVNPHIGQRQPVAVRTSHTSSPLR